ncbi:beta-ketoacyl synthase N-terminal-like domain-containing protein [Lentzea sp. NPDC092896]|uniref:beta-ketoacyl synthase N-terminal-like domain-containing protein n=1 Tax=Lentzea sp. NPDC092896 TaxID=3364127 RepID=UPI0037FBA631
MSAIAVIGMSCRVPGAAGPAEFLRNLVAGRSSVTEVPEGRWQGRQGFGGFVDGLDAFDSGFFGMSRREATWTDPQQRLLLELAWECVEDAAVSTADVKASRWGVFVGACADDFRQRYLASGALDRHGHMGTSRSMLANRVSYFFGLRGPSEVVDTGQSSSLVAVHRAVSAIRTGECDAAIAGGVNLNLLGEVTEQIELWGGLSPNGRCHTFDERANGYVRGEGGGLVVLKPLEAALRDGDAVHAVIRGSATAHDGGPDLLGTPSADAQQDLVEAAHKAAGVSPEDVAYVELHGTGTPAGDPVEAQALGAAIGRARRVKVGSVKTNVGHLESAAGVTGLLKACLMIRHAVLPPSLNFTRSSLPLDKLNLEVVAQPEDLALRPHEVIGVSSFGMGGTNAHVVVGPPPVVEQDAWSGNVVWCLSARSPHALGELARRLIDHDPGDHTPADVAWTLLHRTRWEHRAVVVGSTWDELRQGLASVLAGNSFAVPRGWAADAGVLRAAGEHLATGDPAAVLGLLGAARKVPSLPTHPFDRTEFPVLPDLPVASTPEPDAEPAFADEWRNAPDRSWRVRSLVERELGDLLGEPLPRGTSGVAFRDLGVDSQAQMELVDRINTSTGLALADTDIFDCPTIDDLTTHVNTMMEASCA